MATHSFKDKISHDLFHGFDTRQTRKFRRIEKIIRRKLDMIHYAAKLTDLKSPPGNRLEALKGNLTGRYSIRINDQFRIVFRWSHLGPEEVWITDYHT